MSMVTAGMNPLQVDLKVKEALVKGLNAYQPVWKKIFKREVPDRLNELYTGATLNSNVDEVEDGSGFPAQTYSEYMNKSIKTRLFKDQIIISDFTDMFDNYKTIPKFAAQKAYHFSYKVDQLAADIFNNGTATSGTYGITIAGTTYPLYGTAQAIGATGSTQSNRTNSGGTADETTLNDAIVALMGQKSADNATHGYQARRWLVPKELVKKAHELLDSNGSPEDANQKKNYFNGLDIQIIPWTLLTSTTASFLMADMGDFGVDGLRMLVKMGLSWERVKLDSGHWAYQMKMAVAPGATSYDGQVSIGL